MPERNADYFGRYIIGLPHKRALKAIFQAYLSREFKHKILPLTFSSLTIISKVFLGF